MGSRIRMEKAWTEGNDTTLLMILILLVGIGLASLFSASSYFAEKLFHDPWFLLRRQAFRVLLGSAAALFVSRVNLQWVRSKLPLIILGVAVLNLLPLVPGIGSEYLGGRRWIVIFNQSFQPSELAKAVIILYLAHIFSKNHDRINDLRNTILPPLLLVFLLVGIVYAQNDFSTAAFLFSVSFAMFFVAGIRILHMVMISLFSVGAAGAMILARPYRMSRILTWFNPSEDPAGAGYQILSARRALESGGLWGRGMGSGIRKLGGLPEAHSDFVFAVVGEELGFVGILAILGLFILFAVKGYSLAEKCRDPFGRYLVFGVVTSIFFQALLNMAVISGLVPATGIPLPFFSSGGSSLLMSLVMCGLLLNVGRREISQSASAEGRDAPQNTRRVLYGRS